MSHVGTLVAGALLVAAGALAWSLQLRPALRVEADALRTLPHRIEEWRGERIPLDRAVESMLRADANVQRLYRHPRSAIVWLYVGYYGTDRGGTPEHTPRQCYRAHGWEMSEFRTVVADAERGLRMNEAVVRLDGRARLVHYWYRSHRGTVRLSALRLRFEQVWGRLSGGRADGALVRLSTPLGPDGDRVQARARLVAFARALEPELAARWPVERAVD